MYKNGSQGYSQSYEGTANYANVNLAIGSDTLGSKLFFSGTIDDVMIFNRTLSAEEIQGLYANKSSEYLEVNYTDLAEGSHTFKAYTQDIAGNVNSTETRTVTISLDSCSCPEGQNWNWDLADNCYLEDGTCDVLNITTYGSGTWTLDNYTINAMDFDMNSSGNWNIIGMPNVRIIGP